MRFSSFPSALLATVVALSACSNDPEKTAASEPPGTLQFALVQAPSNLACMRVTVTGNVTSTQFVSVTPNMSTQFMLMGLPTGAVTVKADGFSQTCATVTATTVPAWISNVVSTTLTPGTNATVALTMMANGSATISADFPTPNPTTPDTTRPTLSSFTPVNGATNVNRNSAINAVFSEPIALASLTPGSFSIDDLGLVAPGNYTTLGNSAIFTSSLPLGPNQLYTARLGTGVRDLAGNALLTGTSWTFRTQAGTFNAISSPQIFGVSTTSVVLDHALAASRNGDVFAAWTEFSSANGIETLNVNRFVSGLGWGTVQTLQTVNTFIGNVALAADPMGDAVVVWSSSSSGGASLDLFASRFQPMTGWSAAQPIEPFTAANEFDPSVAMDAAGNAIVAWVHDDTNGSQAVFANRLVSTGWGVPQQVSGTAIGHSAARPIVASTPGGDAFLVWYDVTGTGDDVWANRFLAASGWGTPQLIEADPGVAFFPTVAADAAGNATAVWEQSDGTHLNVVANRFVPASGWGTPQIIDNDTTGDVNSAPVVGMDAAGNALALWTQTETATATTFITRVASNRFSITAGWGTPQIVASGTTSVIPFNQQLAVDGAGNALASWDTFDLSASPTARRVIASRFTPALGWAGVQTVGSDPSFVPLVAADGFGRGTVVWRTGGGATPIRLSAARFE